MIYNYSKEFFINIVLISTLIIGCTTPTPQADYTTPSPKTTKSVFIISDPPGARIEVNDDYVGDAPITVNIPSWSDGGFLRTTSITASPIRDGDYVQNKLFFGNTNSPDQCDQIPKRIFFDMTIGRISSPATQVDVDINNN
jgi:hypothetical protein